MNWSEISIGEIGHIVTGDTPPRKNPEYFGSAYPFIKPTDMCVGQRLTNKYEEGYSQEGYEKYKRKLIPAGSTAVVTIGSIGQKITYLNTDAFVNQAVNAVIPDVNRFNKLYVYYLLKHNLNLVKQADTGASSGRENVSKSNFSALKVWACLDKDKQSSIAEVLDSLDSLIEVNQRRICLIEDSVQRLYREWFVNLSFPGYESVAFSNGVPEGWGLSTVAAQCSFLNRGITPKYDDSATGLVINQKCIRNSRLTLELARRQSKEVKPERMVQIGDILINSTGAGTLGRVAQIKRPLPDCTVDTHVTIARPTDSEYPAFLGQALLSLEPILTKMGKGATNQLELSRADIGALDIWLPPLGIKREFNNLVWPMIEQLEQLGEFNQLLQKARDKLLPKLMSGQLDVSGISLPDEVDT